MFDNYSEMSADEKAQVKAIHKAIRSETGSRTGNLAWGFVRGFPYRRIERTTYVQTTLDGKEVSHNPPPLLHVAKLLAKHIPECAGWFENKYGISQYRLRDDCPLFAWAKNPDGAIPAPPPREKKPFVEVA